LTTKIVKILSNAHANLDSFPLRFGFNFPFDSPSSSLTLTYDQKDMQEGKKKNTYSVLAKFINPETNKEEKGFFVLVNNYVKNTLDEVITVMRERTHTEKSLSEVMKYLRLSGEITVNELIQMHPLYKNGKITQHADLIKHLAEKKSAKNAEKFKKNYDEVLIKLTEANNQIDELGEELDQYRIDSKEKDEQILSQHQQITELNQIAENENKERKELSPVQRTHDYPSVDWDNYTVTTGIFDYWSEQGDFLHIYMIANKKPVRLKNTFKYDYPKALDAVKKLSKGEKFEYLTKGSGVFATDEWFSKIINPQGFSALNKLGSAKTLTEKEMIQEYGEPPEWVKNHLENPMEDEHLRALNVNWDRVEKFKSSKDVMLKLNEQVSITATTFKVIYAERYPGSWFMHNWKRDMVVLYTDQGWFIDTTVREHGGTEWIEDDTYHNCRVTMTKGNKTPYWLQK